MIALDFRGDMDGLAQGIRLLAPRLGLSLSPNGIPVQVAGQSGQLRVSGQGGAYTLAYGERVEFFRGLALLADKLKQGGESFEIAEKKRFDTCGIMLDVSRNAVLKQDTVKDILQSIALMGLNMAMLYTEDTYQLDGYPYFGYMRGAYSRQELKDLDAYAAALGIELVPCIQTLAHLATTLRWQYADGMKDNEDILLIDEPETYRLIEAMVATVRECFSSSRIHIGMDEAYMVGLGQYYRTHGPQDRFETLSRHLGQVAQIVAQHGMQPMMWNDMFFRLGSKTGAYRDLETKMPAGLAERIPNVGMVHWDYYTEDEASYDTLFKMAAQLGQEVIFAGGIWAWESLGVNYQKTFAATLPALASCVKNGVRQVIATIWQNEGAEISVRGALLGMQLFAEYNYCGDAGPQHLAQRFRLCTGFEMDAFLLLQTDDFERGLCQVSTTDTSKQVLFQDILQGLFDKNHACADLPSYYGKRLEDLTALPHQEALEYLFEYQRQLVRVLHAKCSLGIDITDLYRRRDREGLQAKLAALGALKDEVYRLKELARTVWYTNNKPFGFDSLDLKLGGVMARIDTAVVRIADFLAGRVACIEELDEERLMYRGEATSADKPLVRGGKYANICKASV